MNGCGNKIRNTCTMAVAIGSGGGGGGTPVADEFGFELEDDSGALVLEEDPNSLLEREEAP